MGWTLPPVVTPQHGMPSSSDRPWCHVSGADGYLIPTAEVPITNLHAGETLDESQLPIKCAALPP